MGAFYIEYMSRVFVKGEAFTDLMAEFAKTPFFKKKKKFEKQNMDGKSTGMISLHQTLCPGGYILMMLQIKGDLKWG